jgi:hypothetical protein
MRIHPLILSIPLLALSSVALPLSPAHLSEQGATAPSELSSANLGPKPVSEKAIDVYISLNKRAAPGSRDRPSSGGKTPIWTNEEIQTKLEGMFAKGSLHPSHTMEAARHVHFWNWFTENRNGDIEEIWAKFNALPPETPEVLGEQQRLVDLGLTHSRLERPIPGMDLDQMLHRMSKVVE